MQGVLNKSKVPKQWFVPHSCAFFLLSMHAPQGTCMLDMTATAWSTDSTGRTTTFSGKLLIQTTVRCKGKSR